MIDHIKSIGWTELTSYGVLLIGHASFLLTYLSYSQKSLIRLRMVAVVSLLLGLVYNTWINSNMPEGQDIHLVVFYLAVFLLQNIYVLSREIHHAMEVTLPTEQRELLVSAFPSMHSRDWVKLVACAKKREFRAGDEILALGAATTALQLIASGVAQEHRKGVVKECRKGVLWGELTFVLGLHYFNASPVSIVARSDRVTVLEWPYETLRKLSAENQRFNAALQNGFVHSAGMKHGLLSDSNS